METAVKAIKYHIIAGLATVGINCPLQLGDAFLPQMQDTLNLLQTTQSNPTISAFEDLKGPFDYNKTPMAVLGTKALAFIDPDERQSWQAHGVDAYVVGRCPLHYRLLEFYSERTRSYIKTGTYKLYPKHSLIPALSEADRTLQAAQEMLSKLQTSIPEKAQNKIDHNKAIEKLTSILNQNETQDNLRGLARVGTAAPPQNNE